MSEHVVSWKWCRWNRDRDVYGIAPLKMEIHIWCAMTEMLWSHKSSIVYSALAASPDNYQTTFFNCNPTSREQKRLGRVSSYPMWEAGPGKKGLLKAQQKDWELQGAKMMKTEPDHVDTMEAKSFSLNPKQAEMTRSPKLHENLKAFQSTTQKWYILPIGGLYGTYHLLREPRNSIDPVTPSQFWWPWMSRDYMAYQKKTVSKISPTYPWKMPPTFHQQLLKDFFLCLGKSGVSSQGPCGQNQSLA